MLDYFTYWISQNEQGVWECMTVEDPDDYTGLGLSAAEAYQDWLESNNIIVDGRGYHTYKIMID